MSDREGGALETGAAREELHFRRIDMRGYSRSDGLFELEARVTDRKPSEFAFPSSGRLVSAGEPIHDMGVGMVFDGHLEIREIRTFTDAAPYADCPDGGNALQSVVGLRMTSGWSREVRARLSGNRSCTHLMELLIPMATAAFQSLSKWRQGRPDRLDATGRPAKIDSCYAYGAERDLVMRVWPQFHRASLKQRE